MTKNELKINVFTKTFIGRTIAVFEWMCLLAAMALITSHILFRLIITDNTISIASLCNGVTMACSFCGFLIGLNIKTSLIIWRIWPMNKKVAKKFIDQKKSELSKIIEGRDAHIKSLEESMKIQIICLDKEMDKKKLLLKELIQIEKSL